MGAVPRAGALNPVGAAGLGLGAGVTAPVAAGLVSTGAGAVAVEFNFIPDDGGGAET